MNASWSAPKFILYLRQQFEQRFQDRETVQFLKVRNARMTVQQTGSQSFYTLKVAPKINLTVKGDTLVFRMKVFPNQTLRASVYSKAKRRSVADVTVPYKAAAGSMKLELDEVLLKMDIDADSSLQSSS